MTTGLLSGVTVLELSSYVATPLAGLTLAQLGADVVRVEPPGGAADRSRLPVAASGTSYYWSGLNKGKRAIEVDLTTPEGQDVIAELAAGVDAVIANAPHRGAAGEAALRARSPRLVHVQLTGTWTGEASVDYLVQASSGMQAVTGPAGSGVPVNHVLPAWDVAAGLYLANGVLAALRHRDATGEGSSIALALEDVALATMGNLGLYTQAQVDGVDRAPDGNYVYGTFGRDFELADGTRIMLVVLTTRHWHTLLEVTGLVDGVRAVERGLGIDLDDETARYEHRELVAALLAPWFARRDLAGLVAACEGRRLLWSAYRDLDAAARDLADNPLFAPLDQPGVGAHLAPGSPLVVGGLRAAPRAAPAVGQHTREVLAERLGADRCVALLGPDQTHDHLTLDEGAHA
ncbi:CoA transferase [Janibacter melonis]|uniref:CoA transferase n=1 Tax=Janibacter melonis TaxID=262209 RepID=UPI001918ABC4|nr:CoA transferase [Janibacter melonis]